MKLLGQFYHEEDNKLKEILENKESKRVVDENRIAEKFI
jgi:hypothetical protein